jgi:hypothetical protein
VHETVIQILPEGDADAFDQAYTIYHDAIELSEQRTEEQFRKLRLRPDYRFLVAKRNDVIVGLSVSYVPSEDYFWLFEYAAVAPWARGFGVGAQLFEASRELAGAQRVALVEVDADRGEEAQSRRLNFYRRLGCRRLGGLEYLLPLEAFGQPPPMWLLALAQPDVRALDVNLVERWLRSIFEDVYAQRLDDPRLARMIDPLPDRVPLDSI